MRRRHWQFLKQLARTGQAVFLALLFTLMSLPVAPPAKAAIGAVWNATKTVAPSIATPGSQVTYTITITNQGDDKDHLNVIDTLPAGFTFNAVGALPAGSLTVTRYRNSTGNGNNKTYLGMAGGISGTATLTPSITIVGGRERLVLESHNNYEVNMYDIYKLTVNVPAGTADGAYANDLLLDGQAGGINRDLDLQDQAIVTVGDPPNLEVSKVSVPGAPVTIAENSTIDYQITVRNSGAGQATNLTVTDVLPSTFSYAGPSTYSLNGGPATPITPTVALPNVTWNFTSLPGNDSTLVISFTARSGTGAGSHGTWSNTVDVTASNAVDASSGPTAPVSVVTQTTPVVTKTVFSANKAGPPYDSTGADLEITYQVQIQNPTSVQMQNLKVVDDLPDATGWTYKNNSATPVANPDVIGNQLVWDDIGNIAAFATYTFRFTLIAPKNRGGTHNDTVTVSGPNINTVSTGPVAPVALRGPAYTVTKTASIPTAPQGVATNFQYTITVKNVGNLPGRYRLVDTLPANTVIRALGGSATQYRYTLDTGSGPSNQTNPSGGPGPVVTYPNATGNLTINPGQTHTFVIGATITPPSPGMYYNQASVSDTVFYNTEASTGLTAGIQVGTPPSMTISKSVDQSLVLPLASVIYTVRVTNTSPSGGTSATNVDVSELLPSGFNYQPGTSQLVRSWSPTPIDPGEPTNTFGGVKWDNVVPSLAPGNYFDLSFQVQVGNTPGSYDNVATTEGDNFGNISTGPTANVVVGNPPTLSISKTHSSGPLNLGVTSSVTYTITVTNSGSIAASGITVSDTLPTDTTYVTNSSQINMGSGYVATGDPSGTSGTVSWSGLPNIPAGSTMLLRFSVSFPGTLGQGSYPNNATVTSTNAASASTGPTAPVQIGDPPNMRISAATSSSNLAAPTTFKYTVTITNANAVPTPSTGKLARVSVILPPGMNYVGGSTQWTNGGGTLPLAPSQTGADPMALNWDFGTALDVTVGLTVTLAFDVQLLAVAETANGTNQGYYLEAQTVGTNYGLISTGVPPGAPTSGSAAPPLIKVTAASAVSLRDFAATADRTGVQLAWQTGSEWQNMGFNLLRGSSEKGPFQRLNTGNLKGLGTSQAGATYHFTDGNVTVGETYYYLLEDVEFGGTITHHGPLTVTIPADGTTTARLERDVAVIDAPDFSKPTVPPGSKTSDTMGYVQVVSMDETGMTLRLKTPTVQVHTDPDGQIAAIEKLPLISSPGLPKLPQAVIPIGIPAELGYTVTVLDAKDAVTIADFTAPVNQYRSSGYVAFGKQKEEKAVDVPEQAVPAVSRKGGVTVPAPAAPAAKAATTTSGSQQGRHLQFAFGVLNNGLFPASLAEGTAAATVRQHRILQLKLYPVQYDAGNKSLTQYRDITVRLAFDQPAQMVTEQSERSHFDRAFDLLMAEYDLLQRWEAPIAAATDDYQPFGGDAFKLTVAKAGLYQLTAAELGAAGVDLSRPELLRLFYRHQELPLDVTAPAGTVESIRFFAPDNRTTYGTETVLFLVNDAVPGKRMTTVSGHPSATAPALSAYQATVSTDTPYWFWRQMPHDGASDYWFMDFLDLAFTNKATSDASFTLSEVAAAADRQAELTVGLRGEVVDARVKLNNHVAVAINGVEVGKVLWSGTEYAKRTFHVPMTLLHDGKNTVRLTLLTDTGASVPVAFVDSVDLTYWRAPKAEQGQWQAKLDAGAQVNLTGFTGTPVGIYDVTDPADPRKVEGAALADGTAAFAATEDSRRYWVADAAGASTPAPVAYTPADELHAANEQTDYLIITHERFMAAARRLAAHRAGQGLTTRIVDVQSVYDEFSGGHAEPEAIKRFLEWAVRNWPSPKLSYVVLFGDGSFDYRNDYESEPEFLTAFIPPHLRPSLHIGLTADDNWFASVVGEDELPDLFLGRLPANTEADAEAMVDKIVAFERGGSWAGNALTVADDDDLSFGLFAEEIRQRYAGSFGWTPLGVTPADGTALAGQLNAGTGHTLFVGHGGVDIWATEGVLDVNDVGRLAVNGKAGLFVAANCLTAYFQDPDWAGLGETLLREPNKGAAAYLGGGGYTLPASQYTMLRRFYRYGLEHGLTIGAAMTTAKIGLFMDDAPLWQEEVANWLLLGDPAMAIKPPTGDAPPQAE